ncbi:hypothetical protein KORDIASMS9_03452 [Kordia sp. SMS9]|uniref:hypothetical protein n=1 Tax=Kordia sp. SMS9 TaxID=2282170 RepID=UPI000E0D65A6|nr:hypothetical protein [Kordia sp. SMS9]AXG71196.1 hypothetical protein KORDIASMS9_03452 [Kordia sp. SMS9]
MDILQIIRIVILDGGIIIAAIYIVSKLISSITKYILTYKLTKLKLSNDYKIQSKKQSNQELAIKLSNLNDKFDNLHIEDDIIIINKQKELATEKPRRYNRNQEVELTVKHRNSSES